MGFELGYVSDKKLNEFTSGKNWFAACILGDGPAVLSKIMLVVIPADFDGGNVDLKKDFQVGIGNHSFRVTIRGFDNIRGIWRKLNSGAIQESKQATVWPVEVTTDLIHSALMAHPALKEELLNIQSLAEELHTIQASEEVTLETILEETSHGDEEDTVHQNQTSAAAKVNAPMSPPKPSMNPDTSQEELFLEFKRMQEDTAQQNQTSAAAKVNAPMSPPKPSLNPGTSQEELLLEFKRMQTMVRDAFQTDSNKPSGVASKSMSNPSPPGAALSGTFPVTTTVGELDGEWVFFCPESSAHGELVALPLLAHWHVGPQQNESSAIIDIFDPQTYTMKRICPSTALQRSSSAAVPPASGLIHPSTDLFQGFVDAFTAAMKKSSDLEFGLDDDLTTTRPRGRRAHDQQRLKFELHPEKIVQEFESRVRAQMGVRLDEPWRVPTWLKQLTFRDDTVARFSTLLAHLYEDLRDNKVHQAKARLAQGLKMVEIMAKLNVETEAGFAVAWPLVFLHGPGQSDVSMMEATASPQELSSLASLAKESKTLQTAMKKEPKPTKPKRERVFNSETKKWEWKTKPSEKKTDDQ